MLGSSVAGVKQWSLDSKPGSLSPEPGLGTSWARYLAPGQGPMDERKHFLLFEGRPGMSQPYPPASLLYELTLILRVVGATCGVRHRKHVY